jgi:hypothetical protein
MGSFVINLILIVGFILAMLGAVEVYKKFNRDFTGADEIVRLRELNRRIRTDISNTLNHSKNCFKIFNILVSTRYRNFSDPLTKVTEDRVWLKSREFALKSAKSGYKNCNKFLKISLDQPEIILLREAFAYCIETCLNCLILEGKGNELRNCPVAEAMETGLRKNG